MVLTDPRFLAQLNGGQMTVPEAVEQSLWDEPPFSTVFAYFAKQDTELGGQRIRRGDGLLFAPAPGNVDPRVRPDLAANMQGNRAHLAFGGGPHECPGQDIGRAIADVGVDALLTRLPDVQLACAEEDLRWTTSIASRHLVELPVRFEPKPEQDIMVRPTHGAVPPPRPVMPVTLDITCGPRRGPGRSAPGHPPAGARRTPARGDGPAAPARARTGSRTGPRPAARSCGRTPGAASWPGGAATDRRPARRPRCRTTTRRPASARSAAGARPP